MHTVEQGTELWKTDGTEQGTQLVGETEIGPGSIQFSLLLEANGHAILFTFGSDNFSVWSSDGSSLRNLGSFDGYLGLATELDSGVAFSRFDSVTDEILWTDGTSIARLSNPNLRQQLFEVDGHLVISTSPYAMPSEIVSEDISIPISIVETATQLVERSDKLFSISKDESGFRLGIFEAPDFELEVIQEFENVSLAAVQSLGDLDEFFFVVNEEQSSTLWRSDGTANGTNEIVELVDQSFGQIEQVGDRIFIQTFDQSRSSISLLKDGTIKRLATLPGFVHLWTHGGEAFVNSHEEGSVQRFHLQDDQLRPLPDEEVLGVFEDKVISGEPGEQFLSFNLNAYDLVTNEQTLIQTVNIPSGSSNPQVFVEVEGRLLVTSGSDVLAFDGHDFHSVLDRSAQSVHAIEDRFVYVSFGVHDREEGGVEHFAELLISDATAEEPRQFGKIIFPYYVEIDVFIVGNRLFFRTDSSDEVWVSDNGEDIQRLSEIAPQIPRPVSFSGNEHALYFLGLGADGQSQLWLTDGTEDGTSRIPGVELNGSAQVHATSDGAYIVATNENSSGQSDRYHLYRTEQDGRSLEFVSTLARPPKFLDTPFGTFTIESSEDRQRLLRNSKREVVAELGTSTTLDSLGVVAAEAHGDDEFYFSGIEENLLFDGNSLVQIDSTLNIWRSDGTPAGTKQIARQPVAQGSNTEMVLLDDMLFFSAVATDGNNQLWATDGTDAGTYVYEYSGAEPPSGLATFGDRVVFVAESPRYGRELWEVIDPRPLRADIDDNDRVDFADFTLFSSEFGQQSEGLASDIDNDGDVDFSDFLMLTEYFGRSKATQPEAPLETLEPRRVDLVIADF